MLNRKSGFNKLNIPQPCATSFENNSYYGIEEKTHFHYAQIPTKGTLI